jgi:hypothetical protein
MAPPVPCPVSVPGPSSLGLAEQASALPAANIQQVSRGTFSIVAPFRRVEIFRSRKNAGQSTLEPAAPAPLATRECPNVVRLVETELAEQATLARIVLQAIDPAGLAALQTGRLVYEQGVELRAHAIDCVHLELV